MPHNTRVHYLVEDGLREFDLSVPYLDRNHIKVVVNGSTQAITWLTDSRIRLNQQPANGSVVRITRQTPIDEALVTFHDGSNLTKEELNTANLQHLYRAQEQDDFITGSLDGALVRLGDQLGIVTSPEAVADELLRISVFGEDTLDRLRANIAGIDLNAQAIVNQALQLSSQAASTSSLTTTVATLSGKTATLEGRVDSVAGILDGLADLETGGLATLIQNEADERIDGDTALAQTLSLVGAMNGAGNAFDLNLSTLKVSPTESLGTRLTALSSANSTNLARIIAEETARATAVSAEAARIDLLVTRVGATEASITTEALTRSNADGAFASTIALLGAKNSGNTGFILNQNTVLTGPTETLAQKFTQILATAGTSAQALVTSEATARANADAAEANARTALAVLVANNAAAIINEATLRTDADTAEATARQQLAAIVGTNTAAIQMEATARANADSALAQTIAIIGVTGGGGSSFILDMSKVQVGGGVSLGTRLSGIDTSVGTATAAVATETNARTTADTALANSISTVSTTLGQNTAAVTALSTTVNGLSAKAGVSLNVNGFITGWVANNNGSSGDFSIMANRFAIVDPGAPGSTPVVPFEISGGVTRIRNALIDNLEVNRIGSGIYNGVMNIGAGKIVFDNGSIMRVMGVGFGTSNQFLSWFGPSGPIASCSEANAISYEKTNGDCYFGGSLSAGTLTTKSSTSDLSASALAETADFGSNGNMISVVVSYAASSSYQTTDMTPPFGPSYDGLPGIPQSCTVKLYRSINGSAYTEVATLNATGVAITSGMNDGDAFYTRGNMNCGGSITYTDPTNSTATRKYKAQIVARSVGFYGGGNASSSQRVSVICTEQ